MGRGGWEEEVGRRRSGGGVDEEVRKRRGRGGGEEEVGRRRWGRESADKELAACMCAL